MILERGETHKESKQLSVWGHYSRHSIGRETSSRETASLGGHRKLELRAAFVGRKHGNGSGGERERKIFNEVMAKFSPNLIKYSLTDPKNLKVTQLCPTLCDPMDYTVHGVLQARILQWELFPAPEDLPNPGTEPRSPILQADSLPTEPPGKPSRWVSLKHHSPVAKTRSLSVHI